MFYIYGLGVDFKYMSLFLEKNLEILWKCFIFFIGIFVIVLWVFEKWVWYEESIGDLYLGFYIINIFYFGKVNM